MSAAAERGEADVIILGATPAGLTAAIAAARAQRSAIVLERTNYVGGLPANGLGATDISTRGSTGGLFLEFVDRIKAHYISAFGPDSAQVRDCSDGYHFEPSVAEAVLLTWVQEYPQIRALKERQFDFQPQQVRWNAQNIESITVTNLRTGHAEIYRGRFFLDATYEGDLVAAAGVPFMLGREGKDAYGEIGAGRTYKLWYGPECEGSTHVGDGTIQAYNYRLCLTDDPSNRVAVQKPAAYDRSEYEQLVHDVTTGFHGGVDVQQMTAADFRANVEKSKQNLPPNLNKLPGISRLFSNVTIPNGKVDANNQHFALISSDLPEENWAHPTASWAWRDDFAERLRSYTEGLLYFAQNDEAIPPWFRDECRRWGLAKDEYADNGHFPRQMYVREGRRMRGKYVFTANDVVVVDKYPGQHSSSTGRPNGEEAVATQQPKQEVQSSTKTNTSPLPQRVPIRHLDAVTASHYALDSHAVRKYEAGRAHLDGFVGYFTQPYSVPYGVMVPDAPVRNLLAPVPVSASHMGFSTLRMEPCWMALGQAAGVAAALCLEKGCAAGDVDVRGLQRGMLEQGAVLVYHPGLWEEGVGPEERAEAQWRWLEAARAEAKG